MNAALWLLAIATGAFGIFVFFGGTVAILFSRKVPWKARKQWAILSLAGAFVALVAASSLLVFSIEPSGGLAGLLIAFAILAPPVCNWAVYNRYMKRLPAPGLGNSSTAGTSPSTRQIASEVAKSPASLWACLAITVCLIVLPGFVAGPVFAPFVVLWALCALALSFSAKFASIRNQRLRNLVIYLSAAVLVCVVHVSRINTAQAKGEMLVAAIKKFQTDNKRYPSDLEELVPKYTNRVPVAAYGRYYYSNSVEVGPLFFYVTLPPFGRRGYCFDATRSCALNFENSSARNEWFDFD